MPKLAARFAATVPLASCASWSLAALAFAAALGIAASTVFGMVSAYSALPFWDQWATVSEWEKLFRGELKFTDLIAQHGEHRILFARLVFYADALWGQGRNIVDLAVIAAIQLGHAVLLIRLLKPLDRPLHLAAAAGVLALLTMLGQWENLVWGFQVQFVGVYLLATVAYLALARAVEAEGAVRTLAFAGCGLALTAAVFSMANGLAAAGVAVVLAVVLGAPLWMSAGLAILTAACAALYLHGYHGGAGGSGLSFALTHPAEFVSYVAHYVGNIAGLLTARPPGSPLHGLLAKGPLLLGAAGLGLAAASLWREARSRFADRTAAVLLAVTAFVLASAVLTALGRLDYGLSQALAPRYQTAGAVFWAAQLIYWTRVLGPSSKASAALGAAIAGLMGLLVWTQIHIAPTVAAHGVNLNAAADSLVSGVRDDAAIAKSAYGSGEAVEGAKILARRRLSVFAEPEAAWPGRKLSILAPAAAPGACIGSLDVIEVPSANASANARASGWAWDAVAARRPRRIVLTDGGGIVTGLGSTGTARPDVVAAVPAVRDAAAGWTGFVRVDGGMVRAFAVLGDGSVCLLGEKTGSPRP